jgi:FkbM family methyltransferase
MNIVKYLLPYGCIVFMRAYQDFRKFGMPQLQAFYATLSHINLSSSKLLALRSTGLNLLPDNFLNELRYVVDVGSHDGLWSRNLLSVCKPEKLLVIEPSPQFAETLQSYFGDFLFVEIHNVAAGEKDGNVEFNLTASSYGNSILQPRQEMNDFYGRGYNVEQKIVVPMKRLDTICQYLPEISLLKIDVQGYEEFVLEGGQEVLKKTKSVIIEVNFYPHYENTVLFSDLHDIMRSFGFYLSQLSEPTIIKDRLLWADAVYLREL